MTAHAERVRVVQALIGGSLDVRKGSLAEQIVAALDELAAAPTLPTHRNGEKQ